MNKFNIKKLIKVSAVALAMISAGGVDSAVNSNTNVHADSIAQEQVAEFAKQDQQKDKQTEAYFSAMNIQKARQDPKFRLTMEQESANVAPDDTDPGDRLTKSYLSRIYAPGYKKGNSNEQHKEFKAVKKSNGAKEASHVLHVSYVPSASTKVAKHSVAKKSRVSTKRTHLSKSPIRKIMNQMNIDKRAIRNDKKHLSARNAKRFMSNYTKKFKSVKRTKREQKRAMATKGAKRYLHYYKDEVKHEKDLVRLTKSIHAPKATKRNARKSLKRVRKNHKHTRRLHKSVSYSRRSHKHLVK